MAGMALSTLSSLAAARVAHPSERRGPGDFDALLRSGSSWIVE